MVKATKKVSREALERKAETNKRLELFSDCDIQAVFSDYNINPSGLSEEQIDENRDKFGINKITKEKKASIFMRLYQAFINPFTAILLILALVSLITDVIIAPKGEKDFITVSIITIMVAISGLLRFIQETRSGNAAEKLSEMVETTTCVIRDGEKREIPLDEVVVGDIVSLAAGDIIPADVRVIKCKDLFVSQSSLTGESEPVEKFAHPAKEKKGVLYRENLAYMGTTIVSGSAEAVVAVTGDDTMFGQAAKTLSKKAEKTSFEKGINSVSWVLIRFMLVMVPVVFFVNGITSMFYPSKGNWLDAFLFGVSVAVGLTPEMLPMIVTTCLAKGAVKMSHKKTIIKNLNSIQNFGAMDVLCTDKTGTLTMDKVVLERHLDVHGNDDARVLRHAFLNSYYQTGLKNLMDLSIIEKAGDLEGAHTQLKDLKNIYTKVDEIPFDFTRRRMSVVVEDKNGKRQLITKGAVEEILGICNYVEFGGKVETLSKELKNEVLKTVDKLNSDGMRVIAVAQRTNPAPAGAFNVNDEADMVLIGYLAFLDPPKDTTRAAIKALTEHGVTIKILTGDNDNVTATICRQVGLKVTGILLGGDVEVLSDEELKAEAEKNNVFAKLSPDQKARVVTALRANGHVVGYMGDGINDAAAMKAADVGISVDTAVDIAKETAHVILLEKDLMVLEQGIIEGRKIYANMIKYIKMTASSNFGNMFSVLAASAFLPFLPMMPIHLILLNLIYDLSCTAIPWDNVDKEFLMSPQSWNAKSVTRFMLWIGPTSSVFDITTYLMMFFVVCPRFCGGSWGSAGCDTEKFIGMFQAGWFIESMWTQTLVVHMIRTKKVPFVHSRASLPLTAASFSGMAVLTAIPFTPLGDLLKFYAPPEAGFMSLYFGLLIGTVLLYMVLVTVVKKVYIRRYKELL